MQTSEAEKDWLRRICGGQSVTEQKTAPAKEAEHKPVAEKRAKVYIDQTLKSVTASCEFFYTNMESLTNNVEHVLNILGMVRSAYHKAKAELM